MAELYLEILGAIARWAIMGVASYFVAKHVITEDQASLVTTDLTHRVILFLPLLMPLVWSIYRKYTNRIKLLTALDAQPGATEDDVKTKVKNGLGATLTILMLVGVAGFTAPACSQNPPPGTYTDVQQRQVNADKWIKDLQAFSQVVINLNGVTGATHVSDRDTVLIRDFTLSAAASIQAYADGKGTMAIVATTYHTLLANLSADVKVNDQIRFYLNVIDSVLASVGLS